MSTMPSVARYMSVHPTTIDRRSTLAVARRLMQAHAIRHLPVVDGERLVGIVSARDLDIVVRVAEVDPETTAVEVAMTPRPCLVSPDAPLDEVVDLMAERRIGSVIVGDAKGIAGIFTAVDACQTLAAMLRKAA